MTWRDGFKVFCDECGKTRETFYDPMHRDKGATQLGFSKLLEREGWTNPDQDHHLCPDCSRKSELEKKMERVIPKKSWISEVIKGLMP